MLRIFAVHVSLASHLLLQARSFESDVDGRFCEHTSLLQMSLQLASPAKEHISIKDSRQSGAAEETSTTETTTMETTMETTTTTLDPDLPFVNLTNVTDTIVDPTQADKITGPAALRDALKRRRLRIRLLRLQLWWWLLLFHHRLHLPRLFSMVLRRYPQPPRCLRYKSVRPLRLLPLKQLLIPKATAPIFRSVRRR